MKWIDRVIVTIYTEKRDMQDCGDCRGLKLVSPTLKILGKDY